jgi:hypothetical protein
MIRYSGIIGIVVFLLVAFLLSNNRKKIALKTVIYGLITPGYYICVGPDGLTGLFRGDSIHYQDFGSHFL